MSLSPHRLPPDDAFTWRGPVGLRAGQPAALHEGGWASAEALALRADVERAAAFGDLDELVAPALCSVAPPAQHVEAVRRFLTDLEGRGVVVEPLRRGSESVVGLLCAELAVRGLADRFVIACAPGLADRWRDDLAIRFGLEVGVATAAGDPALQGDRLVLDHDLAEAEVEALAARPWDLVVVDDAHQVAGEDAAHVQGALSRLIEASRWAALLTPSPARDDLAELRRLVELVRPGTLPPEAEFRARLVDPDLPRTASRPEELRFMVAPALVRTPEGGNRATAAGSGAAARQELQVDHHQVALNPPEQAVVDMVLGLVRDAEATPDGWALRQQLLARVGLPGAGLAEVAARLAGDAAGSPRADALTALADAAGSLESCSRTHLIAVRARLWLAEHDRVVVAVGHPADATDLARRLEEEGLAVTVLHERMDPADHARSVHRWRTGDGCVLVATDAAAGAVDLQPGACLISADLPWDPVAVDQRLAWLEGSTDGALHLATFVATGTPDHDVLRVLRDHVGLFDAETAAVRSLVAELDPETGPPGTGEAPLSFAGRVASAVCEGGFLDDDPFEDVAADLESARRRVRLLEESAERLDDWLPSTPSPAGNRSLLGPSRRAAVLRDVVGRWLTSTGAEVEADEDGTLVVERPETGGAPVRYVFDRAGARAHPGAALLAPGSPDLQEIVDGCCADVPVQVEVAEPVDLPPVDETGHRPEVRLIDRWVEPPTSWSATATWRARHGAGAEEIIEVSTGTPPAGRSERRPLDRGEPLPAAFPGSEALVEQLVDAAAGVLLAPADALVETSQARAEQRHARRLLHHRSEVDGARAAIEESAPGTVEHDWATERLRALHAVELSPTAVDLDPVVSRVRADLVAVRLDGGDDFVVVERWRHEGGAEAEARYPWDPASGADRRSEVTGEPIEVLAVCADGHLVDDHDLVWCPCCEQHGCAACGPDRAVAACLACGTAVCASCRLDDTGRFRVCRTCRAPERQPERDTEHGRAWALGGGTTLLVGARAASLQRPDEEPVSLVPDADVDDPARQRLRAAADAVGLPLDIGAGHREPVAPPAPAAADAWVSVTEGVQWKLEPGWGAEVAADLDAFDGPDGPEPLVTAESAVGLELLLGRLREDEPPPAPPAYVRTPYVDVERTAVGPDGLERTCVRVGSDGVEEVLAEEQAELVGDAEGALASPHLFRTIAAAELGDVQLVLTRLHRSTVARVTTPAGTDEWFLPGSDGATFGAELAWASWADEEGLDAGAVLTAAGEAHGLEADLAAPTGAGLVHRTVVEVWGAEETAGDQDPEPVDDSDLALVGYEEVPDLAMPRPPRALAELGRALHARGEALDPVAERAYRLGLRWCEVEEVWRGHSEVRLAYKVPPEGPAWPPLDDTHERAADFEVDDHGHLYEPGTGWECLACREHHCRACGPVGAMDACGTCGQQACGLCRARAARSVPEEVCQRCGARSCGDCGRVPGTETCTVCRRSVCARCRPAGPQRPGAVTDADGRCDQCADLRPATPEEVDGLPAVLCARGLHVLLGVAEEGEVVVVLLGAWRTEVAVVRGTQVGWWVHHDTEDRSTRRLLLAAAQRWQTPGDLVPVTTGWSKPPEAQGPAFLLVAEETPEVRWTVEVDGRPVGGTATPPRSIDAARADGAHGPLDKLDAEVADVVLAEVAKSTPDHAVPLPAPGLPEGADDPVAAWRAERVFEPAGHVQVEDRRRATATWLTPQGLQRLVSDGDGARRTSARWQVGVVFSWMQEGWEPAPEVVAYALLGEFEAALVRVGRHLSLGVHGDGRVVWWTLRDEPGDLQRMLLGEHLTGEEQVLDLRVVTDPGKIDPPVVLDATFVERRVEPVLEEVGEAEGDPEEALRAAAAWVRRNAASPEPTGPPLPAALVADLVAAADELSPPKAETVGLALQVVETWRQGLDEFPVPYRLAPGTTTGLLTCAATGSEVRVVRRDRSGHLVAEVTPCPSCGGDTCEACHDRAKPCAVCAQVVCGRCATEDGRCPTCASLAVLDRKEAKRLGVKVGRRAVVLRSTAPGRVVTAVQDGGWQVTAVDEDGGPSVPLPLPPGAEVLLEELASGPQSDAAAASDDPQLTGPSV
jgi:hypothetical protein